MKTILHFVNVKIRMGSICLEGDLNIPSGAAGLVIFAHGSGSSRLSPRNRHVARVLRRAGLATLLLDLLTRDEEQFDQRTRKLRFDIRLLASRLIGATDWVLKQPYLAKLPIGFFGASTGAAAALMAAPARPNNVRAIVSRGGRPDLAHEALLQTKAPTLLLVGEDDPIVLGLNQDAFDRLACHSKRLQIIPGATHLFEEPGALDEVARIATAWFRKYLSHQDVGSHATEKVTRVA